MPWPPEKIAWVDRCNQSISTRESKLKCKKIKIFIHSIEENYTHIGLNTATLLHKMCNCNSLR